MKSKKKAKKPKKLYRIDFNINTREIIEIYEVSPDGSQVRTKGGWVPSYRRGTICQRPPHEPGFMTAEQIEKAIIAERELLKDKRYKHTAAYIVARAYPVKDWLR